ncbi:protealysin inhibitor emfourin [Nocardioides litoris]|uniref:protealysin inhibitor emfourin n=1 Tax=Nocardioides litoris TaxID=1926648 RepID=UPI0011202B68|nr:protealysin inhibitor emfourin [Nocardioides litoris]
MSRTACFLPPHLLRRLAELDPAAATTLVTDDAIRAARAAVPPTVLAPVRAADAPAWTVHDAGGEQELPGRPVRSAGERATGDVAVDEAADGVAASLALLAEVFGRDSFDGAGAPVLATVHFGQRYVNAFWDGTQLVFGDGDGVLFDRFTKPVDVIGHELAHALTERTAGLVYRDQPGALNESVSDVFAACLKQRLLGQTAAEADWLVGEGLFLPGVQARALRDMRAPGTAYDDPRLGQDPQVGHLDDYLDTTDDNGGVHLNSGIPNRAFHLAAVAIGGRTWEGAGPIWYAALTGGQVGPETDFAGFAAATVAAAGEHAEAVRGAWAGVGVTAGAAPAGAGSSQPAPAPAASRVRVRRTGGFIGSAVESVVDLDAGGLDAETAGELRELVGRVGALPASPRSNHPDAFSYEIELGGRSGRLAESDLDPDLRRIVDLVLRNGQV